MSEEWRPIPGFDGYEVSDQGRVRTWRRGAEGRVLRLRKPSRHTYYTVRLSRGARATMREVLVHQLVMLAFVGPRPDGREVRHLDGNSLNNHLGNLRYGTHSENVLDAVAHGTHNRAGKTHCLHGHEFSPENTRIENRGTGKRRQCRKCDVARQPDKRARRRQRDAATNRNPARAGDSPWLA